MKPTITTIRGPRGPPRPTRINPRIKGTTVGPPRPRSTGMTLRHMETHQNSQVGHTFFYWCVNAGVYQQLAYKRCTPASTQLMPTKKIDSPVTEAACCHSWGTDVNLVLKLPVSFSVFTTEQPRDDSGTAGDGRGRAGGVEESFLAACSATMCCCCLWNMLSQCLWDQPLEQTGVVKPIQDHYQ